MMRSFAVAMFAAVALAGCATNDAVTETPPQPFDPASCYARDFFVYFNDQSILLTPEAREAMEEMGEAIDGCTIGEVRIIGSAEDEGGRVESQEISERRAQVLAEYLNEHVGWPRPNFQLFATGERGAVTDQGLAVPMRRRARIVVQASAP